MTLSQGRAGRDVRNPDPNTGLQGLYATNCTASNSTTLGPISLGSSCNHSAGDAAKTKEPTEVEEIEGLLGRVEESEKQPTREAGNGETTPLSTDVEGPTKEQRAMHEATPTPYRKMCKQCNH